MTTIVQLPAAISVGASDLLPLSQAGLLYSVSVSQVTANSQPLISLPSGDLLGRQSTGAGGPESIGIGAGLALNSAQLAANGGDHASFPVQGSMSISDEIVISSNNLPALLPVSALRGLFSAGVGVSIDTNGVITVTGSLIAGPAGPQGATGPTGPAGATGATGATGAGLTGPAASNSASSIGASDYIALWQNGTLGWISYAQFLGGQTIDQLPSAGPAGDSDQLLVAQGSNTLSAQSFGAIWTYVQGKLPIFQKQVVELTSNTVLDSTEHNNRILVASSAITLTANFVNMGSGFSCTLINLAPGALTMGLGITSGSGGASLPPGASTNLVGLSYSGGSLVWWSGVVPNTPTITVDSVAAPAVNSSFMVTGGVFNDAPTGLDYSTNGGAAWVAAPSPLITENAYSFMAAGLPAGTYSLQVRDHSNAAVVGISNNFIIKGPTISLNNLAATVAVNEALALSGTVFPANAAVQVGISASGTTAPSAWANASVSNASWNATLTPSVTGTFYIWAEQQALPGVYAVSGAIDVVVASITVSAASTGTAGSAIAITGAVSPASDGVNVQLATQNSTAPTSGWLPATNNAGSFTASLTAATSGTYYVWAQDTATRLTTVSSAINVSAAVALSFSINNPGGSYTHGVSSVPLNGGVSPPQAVAVQIVLSTSNNIVPTSGWVPAALIQGNSFWAAYYPTPTSAGNYYVWAETTTGGSPTVSSFTVPVT